MNLSKKAVELISLPALLNNSEVIPLLPHHFANLTDMYNLKGSSLFYNTSARHDRHECDTTETRVTRVQHECYTDDKSATGVKNFDFDNDTSENIFSYPYINYMANERLQRKEQFYSKNYLLEMPRSHAKMRSESAPQNLNFVMAKAISKHYTLDCSCKCPCTFLHSYA